MTETGDVLISDIVVNPEGEGFLAYIGFQPLTAFPPFSGLPPAKYYTGGYAKTKEEATNKAIDIVIEHLTKLKQ